MQLQKQNMRLGARRSVRSLNVQALARPQRSAGATTAGLAGVAALLAARPALADDLEVQPDAVDRAVATVTDVIKAAGGAVKGSLDVINSGVKVLKEGYDAAAPVIKQGVDAVSPTLQSAYKATTDVAVPALQQAVPAVKDTVTSVLKSGGLDVDAVGSTTAKAAAQVQSSSAVAQPWISKAVQFVSERDALTLGEYALGALAVVYFGPAVLGALFGSFRGFAGEVSAVQALDSVNTDGNTALIDIRAEREKENSGLVDVASSASGKVLEVEYAFTEDRRLRGQLRDPNAIEARVTALQIAALKRVSRGSRIILLDRYGSTAKAVARELSRQGFGRVYVVAGGFDGRGGWVSSKLLVKPTAGSFGGGGLSRALGTMSSAGRKALPAPRGA